MAEASTEQQPDLTGSPTQKRKRGTESASPDARRSKRGASASAIVPPPIEAAATAFMDSQPEQALASEQFAVIQNDHAEAASAALASSTAAAALNSLYPTLHVPPSTEETFANQTVDGGAEHHADASAYSSPPDVSAQAQAESLARLDAAANGVMSKRPASGLQVKPAVGSEEWHKMRKDNHKEVERRRRETINEGINELAKIVPGCEKNKGSILQRAVVFITQLKENETQNIEKWTLEKLLTEQAVAELSASNDKLKAEVQRLYGELETWKRVAQNAGLQPPEEKADTAS